MKGTCVIGKSAVSWLNMDAKGDIVGFRCLTIALYFGPRSDTKREKLGFWDLTTAQNYRHVQTLNVDLVE